MKTREECKALVGDYFNCIERNINGYDVEIYCYGIGCTYKEFKENNGYELRGLTFVNNNGVWERHIALNKFFNVNENEDWSFEKLKDKKIVNIQEKSDGSMITFVKFPDGSIRAKSKNSFDSEQAILAQEVFDRNIKLQNVVDVLLYQGLMPVFELISPENQIVLYYKETNLILLNVRDMLTGEYKDQDYLKLLGIPVVKTFNYTLDEMLELAKVKEEIEGWVVRFEDGQIAKIKTLWYLERHRLVSEYREDVIIKHTLEGDIDDMLSYVEYGSTKYKLFEETSNKTLQKYTKLLHEFNLLLEDFKLKYNNDRKAFAIDHAKTNPMFHVVMKSFKYNFTAEQAIVDYILENTKTLSAARDWLES